MKPWYSMTADEALSSLGSGTDGLSSDEAVRRLAKYGPNRIESPYKPSSIRIFLSQFKDYLLIVLIFAAIIAFIAGEVTNAYVILGIVLLVAIIGFVQEYKAEKAMEALRNMVAPEADAFKDGRLVVIPAEDLVPGDIIFLEAGDKIPADGRIIEETFLEIIEASLTGESLPVKKDIKPLPEETALADRKNMVFMGTIVSYGNCKAVVTATGLDTELGKISGMIQHVPEEPPLKKKLDELAKRQASIVFAVSVLVFVLAVNRGSSVMDTLITAIALAVAGVPEALPFIVTLALAYGTRVMAKKKAIIRSLPAVETLGSITAICTDKTGTLTTGEMTLCEIRTHRSIEVTGIGYDPSGSFLVDGKPIDPIDPKAEDIATLLKIGVLSNNADLEKADDAWQIVGDPTEGALIVGAKKAGLLESIREEYVEVVEYPFDSERKIMTTVNTSESGGIIAAMKGAPEMVLNRCSFILCPSGIRPFTDDDRTEILASADNMAERALRVLAMAWKEIEHETPLERDYVESGMIFAGIVGMRDPPRPEAKEAIGICKLAGIRPVMITGDHRLIAKAISLELGIGNGEVIEGRELDQMSDDDLFSRVEHVSVFARVTAEHKVRIVQALKRHDNVVAMTGDGVNDAPALRAADIGVAMGRTGTDVAKEASGIIITDDNFASIIRAIEEGRRIYDNIRSGTAYLLSVSFAELAMIFLGVVLGFPVPLLAVQILWINVIAEEMPAVGLAIEPIRSNIMRKKPRDPKEPLLSIGLLIYTLGMASAIVAGSLGLYVIALNNMDLSYARTIAFVSLGFFTIYNAYSSRSIEDSVLMMNPSSNRMLIIGILASLLAILAAVYIPFMQSIFGTVPLRAEAYGSIAIALFLIILATEAMKMFLHRLKQ
ncbi:MAG: cation-translocating P-type ATPase [Methanotrichaceae archaeon]